MKSKNKKSLAGKSGYLMVSPYLIHFLFFVGFPLVFSFVLIFHKWNIMTPMEWVGQKNIIRLFNDKLFFKSVTNTIYFLIIHIPLQLGFALLIAHILNQKIKFRGFFRAAFFMPVIVSGVVIAILWNQLYSYEEGLINQVLLKLSLPKVEWLINRYVAMPSIAIMATWKNVGLYIVLFLTGMQNIPSHLYEAAEIDGATAVQKFFKITIPMLNPTIILVMILSTIGGFSLFIEPFLMTGGGPVNSTLSAMLYIYKQAFYFNHMGYAATLGFFFAIIVFAVVLIQKKIVETEV